MNSFWISEVVLLLLSVSELEAATSASQFSCPKRNLRVTVDDILRLYFDGIEITGLPYANIWNQLDVLDLPCNTRLIAIHGRNVASAAGILASTVDEYVLTNSTWKCSSITKPGWEGIDFDDSNWMPAVEHARRESSWVPKPPLSSKAIWIWLKQGNDEDMDMDMNVYCRKRLDINECLLGAPGNECDPSMGKCIDTFGGYECKCYEGYANNGSKRCKVCKTSNSLVISVLVNVLLMSALGVLHLQNKDKVSKLEQELEKMEQRRQQIQESKKESSGDTKINEADYEYPK